MAEFTVSVFGTLRHEVTSGAPLCRRPAAWSLVEKGAGAGSGREHARMECHWLSSLLKMGGATHF